MAKETTKSSSLIERIRKTSTIKEASVLSESRFFNRTVSDSAPTPVKALNIALGGDINGGLTPGHTGIAGPSRHFKSNVALLLAASYMKKHKDSVMIFYDSEFGSPSSYFKAFSIDMDRVFHIPVTNLEQLKFDIMKQLEEITDKDNVIIVIDSIGNLASKKEVDDALKESDKTDMTRARVIKGLFRMVTPLLTLKDIPLITILHVYQELGLFPKTIISGGTGVLLSCNTAWIIGRRQNKSGSDLQGYHFVINVEKSRFVREKSQIPITVNFDDGIHEYSGLLDIALEGGFIQKPKQGWYQPYDPKTETVLSDKMYREKETQDKEFWDVIFEKTEFAKWIRNRYQLAGEDSGVPLLKFD